MEYTNSMIRDLINEVIHSDRDRGIMEKRLIDGWTLEKISEYFELSTRQTSTIVKKNEAILFRHI